MGWISDAGGALRWWRRHPDDTRTALTTAPLPPYNDLYEPRKRRCLPEPPHRSTSTLTPRPPPADRTNKSGPNELPLARA